MASAPSTFPAPIEAAAASWLARRDRGLTTEEQAAYDHWLRADPEHAAAVARLGQVWSTLDQLAALQPSRNAPPDPDLLAPRRRSSRWIWLPLLGAAAAVAFVCFSGLPGSHPSVAVLSPASAKSPGQAIVHPGPERMVLEDGSVVELRDRTRVEVQFTPAERRVRLVRGEAFFTVAKNPARPFIVSANRITVRAVGTAFSVGLAPQEISVLVTEGKVGVGEVTGSARENSAATRELSSLVAGQQGVINLAAGAASQLEMKVTGLAPPQIEHALAWEGVRLEFIDLPLGAIVNEFNRYNQKKLVVGDRETAAILVGGTFRADNVDAFVRLLDAGFGVSALPQNGVIVLRKTHGR